MSGKNGWRRSCPRGCLNFEAAFIPSEINPSGTKKIRGRKRHMTFAPPNAFSPLVVTDRGERGHYRLFITLFWRLMLSM